MNKCYFGDCRDTLDSLKEQGVTIQTCITSPPYYGLRQYFSDGVIIRTDLSPEEYVYLISELTKFGSLIPYFGINTLLS